MHGYLTQKGLSRRYNTSDEMKFNGPWTQKRLSRKYNMHLDTVQRAGNSKCNRIKLYNN